MSYGYIKQQWTKYDKTLPTRVQDESVITKKRLDYIEDGLEKASVPLVIGDLTISDSTFPNANIEYDEDSITNKLNIWFPKNTEIVDTTILDTATWSSRKIRTEIDKVASNVRYTCEVSSNEGLIFASDTEVKTLTAKILNAGEDITSSISSSSMKWTRVSTNTSYDDFWNGKNYTGRNVTISANELNDVTSATYWCSYTGIGDDGVTVEASSSITIINMIYEPTDTSVSFVLNTPNGTIFDNGSSSTVKIEATAYEGATLLTTENGATFRWYINGVWIPDQTTATLSYPIVGVGLVTIFTCELRYNIATYKNSVTIQNRKNVTVSNIQPNDPQLGDIWYDTAGNIYKKWTATGWSIITDPQNEITSDIKIIIEALKTSYETQLELNSVREATYYTTESGEQKTLAHFYNAYKESADETTRTMNTIMETAEGAVEIASLATQTADRFNWMIQGVDETSFTLTEDFAELLSTEIHLSGENIIMNGMTSINDQGQEGGVVITNEGYLIAKGGGSIGPWVMSDTTLSWDDGTEYGDKITFGVGGLNLSDKIILSQRGGFTSRNLNIDPDTDAITINAQSLKLNGINVMSFNDTFGIRNFVLTSGNYQHLKTNMWDIDNVPWSMLIGYDNDDETIEEITEATQLADTVGFVSFTKSNLTDGDIDNDFIKIPLSISPNSGSYSFYFRGFGSDPYGVPLIMKMYLMTEDMNTITQAVSFSLRQEEDIITARYTQINNTPYKYIGFKSSDFNVGDTVNIINLAYYKSQVTIRDWQPAPEDAEMSVIDSKSAMNSQLNTTIMTIVTYNDTMSTFFENEVPIFATEADIRRVINEEIPGMIDEAVLSSKTEIRQDIEGLSVNWDKKLSVSTVDSEGNPLEVQMGELFQYVNIVNGSVKLGNNTSDTSLRIFSGDDYEEANISFMEGNSTLAMFAKNMLKTEQVVTEKLNIGPYQMFARGNGNVSLRKVGRIE